MYELEFTFEFQSIDAKDVLYTLDRLCPKIGLSTEDYSTAAQVQKIEKGGHLALSGRLFTDVHGGSVANHSHDFLIVKTEGIELRRLIEFVELFINELSAIQAFVHNYDYYHWQNAEDILLYDSAGKEHKRLRKTSNNLPPPLEQEVVDISNNPGRYVLKDGYRETISSPMWITKSLIYAPDLLSQTGKVVAIKNRNIFRIETAYQTFDKAEGDQAKVQKQLREAVYGA